MSTITKLLTAFCNELEASAQIDERKCMEQFAAKSGFARQLVADLEQAQKRRHEINSEYTANLEKAGIADGFRIVDLEKERDAAREEAGTLRDVLKMADEKIQWLILQAAAYGESNDLMGDDEWRTWLELSKTTAIAITYVLVTSSEQQALTSK